MTGAASQIATTALEVVNLVELKDIFFMEVRAARRTALLLPSPSESVQPGSEVLVRDDESLIEVRLTTTVQSDDARISVDVLVQYTKREPFTASPPVMNEFAHRVGLMAGYPYVREAVSSLSTRLRVDTINLGILTQGDFDFDGEIEVVQVHTHDELGQETK